LVLASNSHSLFAVSTFAVIAPHETGEIMMDKKCSPGEPP